MLFTYRSFTIRLKKPGRTVLGNQKERGYSPQENSLVVNTYVSMLERLSPKTKHLKGRRKDMDQQTMNTFFISSINQKIRNYTIVLMPKLTMGLQAELWIIVIFGYIYWLIFILSFSMSLFYIVILWLIPPLFQLKKSSSFQLIPPLPPRE